MKFGEQFRLGLDYKPTPLPLPLLLFITGIRRQRLPTINLHIYFYLYYYLLQVLEDKDYLEEVYGVSHIIYVTYATMQEDFNIIKNQYYQKSSYMTRTYPNIYFFDSLIWEVSQ